MASLNRLILITVNDTKGKPLSGAEIALEIGGKKIGGARSVNGQVKLQIPGPRTTVTLIATYKKKTESRTLAATQDTWTFTFKEKISIRKRIGLALVGLAGGVAVLGATVPKVYEGIDATCEFVAGSKCHNLWAATPSSSQPTNPVQKNGS